jgi:NADPH-dependent ferric siderophore reductase
VRSWDERSGLLTLDFVVHGDEGVAGPWAAGTAPGDTLVFEGPGSGYRPDPEADWHLLVGDESALPAIAASLEAVPAGRPVVVRLVCDGPEHEIPLSSPGDLDLRWLHRTGAADDVDALADAVSDLDFPPGRVHAFVHGEAEEIRGVRRHLLGERGLTRADMSCSPYWRRTMTDEAWRSVKRDFVAAMEADVA